MQPRRDSAARAVGVLLVVRCAPDDIARCSLALEADARPLAGAPIRAPLIARDRAKARIARRATSATYWSTLAHDRLIRHLVVPHVKADASHREPPETSHARSTRRCAPALFRLRI